jgi:hypothetical protein
MTSKQQKPEAKNGQRNRGCLQRCVRPLGFERDGFTVARVGEKHVRVRLYKNGLVGEKVLTLPSAMTLAEVLIGILPTISRDDFNNLIGRIVYGFCSGLLPEALFSHDPMKLVIRKFTVANDVKLHLSKLILNDLFNVQISHKRVKRPNVQSSGTRDQRM